MKLIPILSILGVICVASKNAQVRKKHAKAKQEEELAKIWAREHEVRIRQAINKLDYEQWATECDLAVDRVDAFPSYKGYIAYYNEWMEISLKYTGKRYPDLHPDSMEDAVFRRIEERQARDRKNH